MICMLGQTPPVQETIALPEFALRIGVAVVLGAMIGMERQWRQRMAGLRTNTLVCTGAALFVAIAAMTAYEMSPTRIAAQVVSGIGFIGAGVIFRQGPTVRGLTTAATLWCAAAVGAMAGSGFLLAATIGALAVLIANVLLRPLTYRLERQPEADLAEDAQMVYSLHFTCKAEELQPLRSLLLQTVASESLRLRSLSSEEIEDGRRVIVHAQLATLGRHDELMEQLIGRLGVEEGVSAIRWEVEQQTIQTRGEQP